MEWSKEAEERIKKAPFFIRNFAKKKAEEVAMLRGKEIVDIEDVELAKRNKDLEDLTKLDLTIEGIENTKYKEIALCGGLKGCPLTLFNVEEVALLLDRIIKKLHLEEKICEKIQGPILYHHKFKAAISGCPNNCSQPQIKDIGIIGYVKPKITSGFCLQCNRCVNSCPEKLITLSQDPIIDYSQCLDCGLCIKACPTESITEGERGYRVIIGGRLGRKPHLAQHLVDVTTLEELEDILTKILLFYQKTLEENKNFSREIEFLGIEGLKL